MKLHFEPNLQYQLDAISSVIRLFEGQPIDDTTLEFGIKEDNILNFIDGIANRLILSQQFRK